MSWFSSLFPKDVGTVIRDQVLEFLASPEFKAIITAAVTAAIAGAVQGSIGSTDAQRPGKGPKAR